MHKVDIVVIGGGIAGLWLLNLLIGRGYSVALLEKKALGAGQTFASQGMIHGGIKYALNGFLNDASETIAAMPARWQACLQGRGTIDLTGVKILSKDYFLFSDASLTSRITAFLGSKTVAGRIGRIKNQDLPSAFKNSKFKGLVYRMEDFVLDTSSLVEELSRPFRDNIYTGEYDLQIFDGKVKSICLADGTSFKAKQYVLAAGRGNGQLIKQFSLPITMQLRPLKQVIVYGSELPDLYAHAVSLKTGDKPNLTITTHYLDDNSSCWYLGGQLAEEGAGLSDKTQIERAQHELETLLPWMDFSNCNFRTYSIDRAEPSQGDHNRPNTPYAKKFDDTIICWPTKLTLTPLLGDMVSKLIQLVPGKDKNFKFSGSVNVGSSPWVLGN